MSEPETMEERHETILREAQQQRRLGVPVFVTYMDGFAIAMSTNVERAKEVSRVYRDNMPGSEVRLKHFRLSDLEEKRITRQKYLERHAENTLQAVGLLSEGKSFYTVKVFGLIQHIFEDSLSAKNTAEKYKSNAKIGIPNVKIERSKV